MSKYPWLDSPKRKIKADERDSLHPAYERAGRKLAEESVDRMKRRENAGYESPGAADKMKKHIQEHEHPYWDKK